MQYPARTGPIVNDAAPFSSAMVAGSHPDSPRLFLAPRIPLPSLPPFIVDLSIDFTGYHPDSPRVFLGPRIPLPVGQITPIVAPFSPEMAAGSHPDSPRIVLGPRIPLPALPPSVEAFLLEFIGYHPDTPRLFVAPRIPLPISQTTPIAAPFSQEMAVGYHPDRSRAWIAAQIGLPISVMDSLVVTAFNLDDRVLIGGGAGAVANILKTNIGGFG